MRLSAPGFRGRQRLLLIAAMTMFAALGAQARELRVAVGSFSGELADPIHGGVGMSVYQGPMFDYLVSFDREMRIVPALAKSWTVSPDGRTYRFMLRDDVRWHDGARFTADDVLHHFDVRLRKGTAPYIAPLLGALASMRVVSDLEIEFVLKAPWPDFLAHLTPGNTSLGAITPKAYSIRVGDAGFSERPVGTGPYRLVERARGSFFRFEAVDHPFRPRPGFDSLRISLVPEESTRIAMLKRGDVDVAEISPDSINWLARDGKQILRVTDSFMTFIGFIGTWEPRAVARRTPTRWENRDVRRALSLAIDRTALVKHLLNGAGSTAAVFPLFEDGYGWDPSLVASRETGYDPVLARALLKQSSLEDGFRISLYAPPLPGLSWSPTLAEVVADFWRKIGVEVDVVSTELGASFPIFYRRPDNALGSGILYRTTRSVFPIGLIQNYVVSKGRAQFAFANWDDRYAALNGILNETEREAAYQAFVAELADTYTVLPLFYMDVAFAASADVAGWSPVKGWPSIGLSLEYFRPAAHAR